MRHRLDTWSAALRGVWKTLATRNIGLNAAGIAFFAMFAAFPAMASIIALWGMFADPVVIENQIQILANIMPESAFQVFQTQIRALVQANESSLGWATIASLLTALWSSRSGVTALIGGLNEIYREHESGGFRQIVVGFALTFALIGVALTALGAVVVAPIILAFLPLTSTATALMIEVLRWSVAIIVLIFGLGVVYRYGPSRKASRSQWITPGAILAVIIWGAASAGFSIYLSNFGGYNKIYGSIGAVIALMMWLYITAYVTLLGAALNAELERKSKSGMA